MALRCPGQRANESFQVIAMEVARLVQLTYPWENHPLIDNFKTEKFVNSILDPVIKLAIFSNYKLASAKNMEVVEK